jgi:hypothetical protein
MITYERATQKEREFKVVKESRVSIREHCTFTHTHTMINAISLSPPAFYKCFHLYIARARGGGGEGGVGVGNEMLFSAT